MSVAMRKDPSLPVAAFDHVAHVARVDQTASAKGGGGGKPGGGGGGGSDPLLKTSYVSGLGNGDPADVFNVTIKYSGTWTLWQQRIVEWAAELISDIITGDLVADSTLPSIDDIEISMSTGRIDGSGNILFGNVLAQTQINLVRDPGTADEWLPLTASIKLDSTDLKNSISAGWAYTWDDIVLHEMLHAIGFAGIIFKELDLIDSFGNFSGGFATEVYGGPVPIESNGGNGTAGSHWHEQNFFFDGSVMSNEVMTGWIVQNEQTVLSDVTVAALRDLGYAVQDPSLGRFLLVNSGVDIA